MRNVIIFVGKLDSGKTHIINTLIISSVCTKIPRLFSNRTKYHFLSTSLKLDMVLNSGFHYQLQFWTYPFEAKQGQVFHRSD